MSHETHTMLYPLGHAALSDDLVGQRVNLRSDGVTVSGSSYSALLSGLYLGVVRSDHTNEPMHLFVDGEVNGIPQTSHGFPALDWPDEWPTLKGSTEAVREWETRVAEDSVSLFYVNGTDAHGQPGSYPGDDYLRNMGADECPLITDDAEAVEDARCALIESEGWQVVHVYRRDPGGMHVLVVTLTPPGVPAPPAPTREILVHLNVTMPATDARTAEEIAAILMDALTVGLEGAADCEVDAPAPDGVVLALCEEL